jgi:hypothetical protein
MFGFSELDLQRALAGLFLRESDHKPQIREYFWRTFHGFHESGDMVEDGRLDSI